MPDEHSTRTSIRVAFAQEDPLDNVVLIRAGEANGFVFGRLLLKQAAPLFEGAPCYADHAGLADLGRQGGRSIRDLVGLICHPTYDADRQVITAHLALRRDAAWLRTLIEEFGDRPNLFGLSADMWITHQSEIVETIERINSVDVVVNPAAGGHFLTTDQAQFQEATNMEPKKGAVRIQNQQPPGDKPTPDHVAPAELPPVAYEGGPQPNMSKPPRDDPQPQRTTQQHNQPTAPPLGHPMAEIDAANLQQQIIDLKLQQSGLPDVLAATVRDGFKTGRVTLQSLDDELHKLTQAWAQETARATIRGLGPVTNMQTPLDRIELAFANLMGVPQEEGHQTHDVARLSGIREMYDTLTGDWERYGRYRPERVTFANATTSTMAEIVRNVLNKVMLRAYEQTPFWWKPIASEQTFANMNTARWITVGGFADLDTVTEGAAYTEKSWDDYAETSDFVKKGNYLGITLEMIDRDDVQAIRALPRRLGYAANRTLSAAVAALFTANSGTGPTLADSDVLFHSNHSNLGSTALAAAEWQVVTAAMFKQAEYSSSKRLGVRPSYCLVPIDLEKAALEIFTSDVVPAANSFYRNVLKRAADAVVVVPEWTDTNNWAAAAHPNDLEGVMVGYRYGSAPELFLAGDQLMGSMFTNDEMRIKVRFIYTVGIGDYRALYKENVA